MDQQSKDPVVYPTIELGGTEYTVIFDASAIVALYQDHGIDLEDIKTTIHGAAAVDRTLKLLAAGISHQHEFTSKQVGHMLGLERIPEATRVVVAALGEVSARVKAATTPAPMVQ